MKRRAHRRRRRRRCRSSKCRWSSSAWSVRSSWSAPTCCCPKRPSTSPPQGWCPCGSRWPSPITGITKIKLVNDWSAYPVRNLVPRWTGSGKLGKWNTVTIVKLDRIFLWFYCRSTLRFNWAPVVIVLMTNFIYDYFNHSYRFMCKTCYLKIVNTNFILITY